jgi:hypothetical protein
MFTTKTRFLVSAAVLAAALGAAGCGSACVAKDDNIVVDVQSTRGLNDTGAGPQHVRFQVWAVANRQMFDNASAEALAGAEGVANFERQGMGKVFLTDSNWIKPESTKTVVQRVEDDKQYGWVGIAVMYPEPRKAIVALDCSEHAGYAVKKPEHHVTFTLAKSAVEAGGAPR